MDRIGADYFGAVAMMQERFLSRPLPVQVPLARRRISGVSSIWIRIRLITWQEGTLGAAFDVLRGPGRFS